MTARQVNRVSWACPDAVCSVDTTLPTSQQHQAGSCSQCGVCRFVCVVCNYVVCMCMNACTCICVVVGMWVCVMRVTPFFSPVSLFSSASVYLSIQGGARGDDRFQQATLSGEVAPLSPPFAPHFTNSHGKQSCWQPVLTLHLV